MAVIANDNDEALPLLCPSCERVGWLGVVADSLQAGGGFDLGVDNRPECSSCEVSAGIRLADLPC